jgi:release factor glutamine methyltransferase
MKVFEAIARATQLLDDAAISNPRLDAERLLAFELGTSRAYLISHFQETVEEAILARFLEQVQLRAQGKPLQYLLGSQEFRGLDFEVSSDVLIPRPETELLVEEAIQHFSEGEPRIVDVGTGSGCVAVSVAVALPRARLWAVDLSEVALEVAQQNAARHRVDERIQFLPSDLLARFQGAEFDERFDGILSNPPYVAEKDLPALQREVRDWEPKMALVGGATGLSIYQRLIPQAHRCLKRGGKLILEIGYNMRDAVLELFHSVWQLNSVREDYSGIPRVVVVSKK